MEIENSETERTGNLEVLAGIEGEITRLEQIREQLSSFEGERDRRNTAVQNLHTEEAQILQETTNETAIVKKLTTIRGTRDVQTSRLSNVQDKIRNAQADLVVQGANVRKAFAGVMAQLWTARQQRVTAMLSELFGPFIRLRIGRAELRELVDQTVLMKELKDSRNRAVQQISDPAQETLALQRSRTWLAEISKLIDDEGLTLKGVPAKQQPIVQPAREMAGV